MPPHPPAFCRRMRLFQTARIALRLNHAPALCGIAPFVFVFRALSCPKGKNAPRKMRAHSSGEDAEKSVVFACQKTLSGGFAGQRFPMRPQTGRGA